MRKQLLFLYVLFSVLSTFAIDGLKLKSDSIPPEKSFTFKTFDFSESVEFTEKTQKFHNVKKYTDYRLGNFGLFERTNQTVTKKYSLFENEQLLTHQNVIFYQGYPTTQLTYNFGSQEIQYFYLDHRQPISRWLSTGFVYNRMNSDGFYLNQNSDHTNLAITPSINLFNNRYQAFSSIIFNSLNQGLNGGITDASKLGKTDNRFISVYRPEARGKIVQNSVSISQFFKLSKPDSLSNYRLFHDFSYKKEYYNYRDRDKDSSYYSNFYTNTNGLTFDSLGSVTINNKFGFSTDLVNDYKTSYFVLFENERNHLLQEKIDTTLYFWKLNSGVKLELNPDLKLGLNGSYVFNGANQGDISSAASVRTNKYVLKLNIDHVLPDIQYRIYSSNHFKWENSFNRITYTSLVGSFQFHELCIKADWGLIDKYVYLGYNAAPEQFNGILGYTKLSAQHQIHFWKKMNWENEVVYQYSSNYYVYTVPDLEINSSLYFKGTVFNSKFFITAGFDVFYQTSYYANAFMPALSNFYVQKTTMVGNYPFLDFFAELAVKRAKATFRMNNLNSSLSGANYYLNPKYPLQGRHYQIAISWLLFG